MKFFDPGMRIIMESVRGRYTGGAVHSYIAGELVTSDEKFKVQIIVENHRKRIR